MLRIVTVLAGVGALGAIGYYGALRAAPGAAAPYSAFAPRIEGELQTAVDEALSETGFEWASAEMDGQTAILRGEAPREDERGEARAAVLHAAGEGGFWTGGVMRVSDQTTLAPPVSPYEWSVLRDGAAVTLQGAVPSRALRADLISFARELFPGGVGDEMIIARGAPDGEETVWAGVAFSAIEQVARMTTGRAVLRDERLRIEGVTDDSATRDQITGDIARLPAPFVAVARIEAPEQGGEGVEDAEGDEDGIDLSEIDDPAVCQTLFDELSDEGEVTFGEGAVIEMEAYALLDRLAIVALRCRHHDIAVIASAASRIEAGEGEDPAELALEQAQAVADYFVLQGVASERVAAIAGADETGMRFRIGG